MWGGFAAALDRAGEVAKRAQEAAQKLESHIDSSLGEGGGAAAAPAAATDDSSNVADAATAATGEIDVVPAGDDIDVDLNADDGWDHGDDDLVAPFSDEEDDEDHLKKGQEEIAPPAVDTACDGDDSRPAADVEGVEEVDEEEIIVIEEEEDRPQRENDDSDARKQPLFADENDASMPVESFDSKAEAVVVGDEVELTEGSSSYAVGGASSETVCEVQQPATDPPEEYNGDGDGRRGIVATSGEEHERRGGEGWRGDEEGSMMEGDDDRPEIEAEAIRHECSLPEREHATALLGRDDIGAALDSNFAVPSGAATPLAPSPGYGQKGEEEEVSPESIPKPPETEESEESPVVLGGTDDSGPGPGPGPGNDDHGAGSAAVAAAAAERDDTVLLARQFEEMQVRCVAQMSEIDELRSKLETREVQLREKNQHIAATMESHESEIAELRNKIKETKDEAKRRILRAKERVEEMQGRLTEATKKASAGSGAEASLRAELDKKEGIVRALREEGAALAQKQSTMEQSVRAARVEARDLQEALEREEAARTKAEERVAELTRQLRETGETLAVTKRGADAATKLEEDLHAAREEVQNGEAVRMSLEQRVKELQRDVREAREDAEKAKKGAIMEGERESERIRRERDEMLTDVEERLRRVEREANLREDALRHEVSELRKRWQDAVRRADSLSMDIQESTAPLMRQLQSAEKQARVRASAWAEVESKLRSDLEESVISNERLSKDRSELRAEVSRLERGLGEKDERIAAAQETIDRLTSEVEQLERQLDTMEREKDEWVEVQKSATEDVAKAKSDMMKTVVDSEERYRAEIDELRLELERERSKRFDLEANIGNLAQSSEVLDMMNGNRKKPQKKLKATTNQADILQSTLVGLGGSGDEDDDDVEEDDDMGMSNILVSDGNAGGNMSSFAAMEHLSQGLKAARHELETLRKQLASSEEAREKLKKELSSLSQASEKLPLFEEKVAELTQELAEKDLEIQALREDMLEVKLMYRQQLDALLEEKAASTLLGDPSESSVDEHEEIVVAGDGGDDNILHDALS